MKKHTDPVASWSLLTMLVASALSAAPVRAAVGPLDSILWELTASDRANDTSSAIDGNLDTRWSTGRPMVPGQWFAIELDDVYLVSKLVLNTEGSDNDYPRTYKVALSLDGQRWSDAVASGAGRALLEISFPPARARHVRIEQGGRTDGNFWSIHELEIHGTPPPGKRALERIEPRWRVIEPRYPTREAVVAGYSLADFGCEPDTGRDVSKYFKLALRLLGRLGGGVLWVPEGRYRVDGTLVVPTGVTLRGEWKKPEPGRPVRGAILEVRAGKGDADGAPLLTLAKGGGVIGMSFWYPEQTAPRVVPYPYTIKQGGDPCATVENVTFVNAYRGFVCGPEGNALYFLRGVYGTVLENAVQIDGTTDIGRLEALDFSPHFWSDSGLPGSPRPGGHHAKWMYENGIGIIMRRNDWSYLYDARIEGYKIGFATRVSVCHENVQRGWKSYANGHNYMLTVRNCQTGIDIEDAASAGIMFTRADLSDVRVGVSFADTFGNQVQMHTCTIDASEAAIRNRGPGRAMLQACTIARGPVLIENGYLGMVDCQLQSAAPQVTLAETAWGASLLGNRFRAGPEIDIRCADRTNIRVDHAPLKLPRLPEYPYRSPAADTFKPASNELFVVTDAEFGAAGDGRADDTAAIARALTRARAEGGIVFLPAGNYRVTRNLVVPSGVELKGVYDTPHHTRVMGSIISVCTGRGNANGAAFIKLESKSGLRGITFHHPDQAFIEYVPYPYTIQGAGSDVYIVNVAATIPWNYVDLFTNRCDNFYVDYVGGHALNNSIRIGGGSRGGRLYNCQLNQHYYAHTSTYNNSPNKAPEGARAGDAIYTWAMAHHDAFVLGECSDLILHQNFVFGGRLGLALLKGRGAGPSGACLGHGSDQVKYPVYFERIGRAGLPLINMQLVTVSRIPGERAYIKLAKEFEGTAEIYAMDAWGAPEYAINIQGGKLHLQLANFAATGSSAIRMGAGALEVVNSIFHRCANFLTHTTAAPDISVRAAVLELGEYVVADSLEEVPEDYVLRDDPRVKFDVPFDNARALPRRDWKVAGSGKLPRDAARAIDGDASTRWSTGRGMEPGDWFTVDMNRSRTVNGIRVECIDSANDYPRRFSLYVSDTPDDWGEPVVRGVAKPDLRIAFPDARGRFIKLLQKGRAGNHWSIHELFVMGR